MTLLDRRFLVVTGKGGVGTTSVAAALAVAAARTGKSVLLCEVQPGGGAGPAVGVDDPGYDPVPSTTPGLSVMAMDTERSVRDFVKVMTRVPLPVDSGPLARILDFVASAAPGVRRSSPAASLPGFPCPGTACSPETSLPRARCRRTWKKEEEF